MKNILEKSRFLSLIAVIALLITFALALFWGLAQAVKAWSVIIGSLGAAEEISLALIKLVDTFLIALVLYLLAASIYRLFIGNIELSSRLVASTLLELKSKLSSMVVLVVTVRFVEALFEEKLDPDSVLKLAVATALVAAVLIAFSYFGSKKEEHEEESG